MENKLIYKKLIAINQELEFIPKEKKNLQQGYNFRGIDDMYNALHPLFAKHGVFITSEKVSSVREERSTKSGNALIYSIMDYKFTFHAEDGSSVSSIVTGEAMDSGDKSANKAISAALKYALMQMFLIPTEEQKDIDPDINTHDVKPKPVTLETAVTEMEGVGSRKEINDVWKKYPQFHGEKLFLHALERMSQPYPKPKLNQ